MSNVTDCEKSLIKDVVDKINSLIARIVLSQFMITKQCTTIKYNHIIDASHYCIPMSKQTDMFQQPILGL